jgi:hypothetical protein
MFPACPARNAENVSALGTIFVTLNTVYVKRKYVC